ncbi:hypothetical protein IW262DRAFT_886112 [Armillaria fumosa]|nr:hypothetical protein IW262DRAFT_886112 [Armillaria fumosa]
MNLSFNLHTADTAVLDDNIIWSSGFHRKSELRPSKTGIRHFSNCIGRIIFPQPLPSFLPSTSKVDTGTFSSIWACDLSLSGKHITTIAVNRAAVGVTSTTVKIKVNVHSTTVPNCEIHHCQDHTVMQSGFSSHSTSAPSLIHHHYCVSTATMYLRLFRHASRQEADTVKTKDIRFISFQAGDIQKLSQQISSVGVAGKAPGRREGRE